MLYRWVVSDLNGVEFDGKVYELGEEFEADTDTISTLGIRNRLGKVGPVEEE